MMKLSLNIPHRYYKDFCDFSDIQIVDLDILKQYPDTYDNVPKDMEVWLNRGTPALLDEFLKRFRSTDRVLKVCSFTMTTVADSFKEVTKALYQQKAWNIPLIGVWDSETNDLPQVEAMFEEVAIPWWRPRKTYIMKNRDSKAYAYFGFSNLDELREHPPRLLHTSVPIMAAYHDIDLRDRIRRPKLMTFDPFITLSKDQVKLAIDNITAIRNAANGSDN